MVGGSIRLFRIKMATSCGLAALPGEPVDCAIASGANAQVQREIEVAEASRNLEKTVMGMRTQQVSPGDAVRELEKTKMMLVEQGKTLQAQDIQSAIDQIKQGAGAEKTLMGTIINLDRGKG